MKERSRRATIRNHQYFRCDFLRQSQPFDRQGTETRHDQGAGTEPSMYVEIRPAYWFNMDLVHPRARRCLSDLLDPAAPISSRRPTRPGLSARKRGRERVIQTPHTLMQKSLSSHPCVYSLLLSPRPVVHGVPDRFVLLAGSPPQAVDGSLPPCQAVVFPDGG